MGGFIHQESTLIYLHVSKQEPLPSDDVETFTVVHMDFQAVAHLSGMHLFIPSLVT